VIRALCPLGVKEKKSTESEEGDDLKRNIYIRNNNFEKLWRGEKHP